MKKKKINFTDCYWSKHETVLPKVYILFHSRPVLYLASSLKTMKSSHLFNKQFRLFPFLESYTDIQLRSRTQNDARVNANSIRICDAKSRFKFNHSRFNHWKIWGKTELWQNGSINFTRRHENVGKNCSGCLTISTRKYKIRRKEK